MQIHAYTKPELDRFRELCNFTEEEMTYFDMKSKRKSHLEISMAMNISVSKVSLLSASVKRKILKVS